MKRLGKKVYRREGKYGDRLFQEIICTDCGNTTYERKTKRIETALNADCRQCLSTQKAKAKAEVKETKKIVALQDKALIASWRAIQQLSKKDKRITHGLSTKENRSTYESWRNMHDRCSNPKNIAYNHYGGRGITVCERWYSVETFFEDMGCCPKGFSLERKDVDGNYEPSNCIWLEKELQSGNRRNCLCNRGIEDPKAHWREHRRLWDRRRKGIPIDAPKGSKAHMNPNAWWHPLNLPVTCKARLYGPHRATHAYIYQQSRYH